MIDELLSARRIEPLEPRQEEADAAWREVTRRRGARTLRGQVLAGVAVVAMVMVGLLPSLDGGGRVANLNVADRDSQQGNHLAPETDDQAAPTDPGGASALDSDNPRRPSSNSPGKSIEAPAAQTVRPGDEAPTPGRAKPAVERSRYGSVALGCIDFCLNAVAEPTGARDFTLALDLCVAVGGRARRFSYHTAQEVDFWVTPAETNAASAWTWSLGQSFPADAHYFDVASSECMRWTVDWDASDDSGTPLAPGQYRLFAKSLAEQTAQSSVTETTFQISE